MGQCLAVVPARKGSKRLPGKNGLRLGGRTLVELAVDCANACGMVRHVCVSTDDAKLFAPEADTVIRPPWLASDTATTEAVVIDAVSEMWRKYGQRYDSVMVLQPTSPLRTADDLTACCDLLDGHDSVVSVTAIKHPPHKTCIIRDNGLLHVPGNGQGWEGWRRDGVCYLTQIDVAMAGDLYGPRPRPYYTPEGCGVSIDTADDWDEAKHRWSERHETEAISA